MCSFLGTTVSDELIDKQLVIVILDFQIGTAIAVNKKNETVFHNTIWAAVKPNRLLRLAVIKG